jgi:hypothetical protein
MTMEIDFRALLAADPEVAADVGTRIYPSTFAQATGDPCIRYQLVSGVVGLHMQGSDGLDEATMQVDIRGLTAASVFKVRDAVRTLLHGFRGSVGNTDFRLISLSSDRGVSFDKTDAEAFYLASLDFTVFSRAAG